MRRHTHQEQERHNPQRGQGLPELLRVRLGIQDGQGDLEREEERRPHGLLLRCVQHELGSRGRRLHKRLGAREDDAQRPHQLHLPLVPARVRVEPPGRDQEGRAPGDRPHNREREPAHDKPRGVR